MPRVRQIRRCPSPAPSPKSDRRSIARSGTRSADGSEFTAEEIVSGAFRNIAGMIVSIDGARGSFTVNDLATKKNVEVKLLADSHFAIASNPMARASP